MGRYTYGDSRTAADRLAVVANVFESTTRAFLARVVSEPPVLAVDLGCGPGHTTRLIHSELHPSRTVGYDQSAAFVELARRDALESVEFARHDVREIPFPSGPADLIFARLLLAHLKDPGEIVALWASQLAPGGILLLDEMEEPDVDDPALARYLELATGVVRSQGGELFVGRAIKAMADPPGTERVADELVPFLPEPARIALMCRMNLDVLRERGEIPADNPELDALSAELDAIVRGERRPATVWRMRQISFRRI